MKNKKGSIGETLTWIVGFTIIFFGLMVFLVASSLFAGKKAIPLFGEGFSSIDIENSYKNFENEKELVNILNTKINFQGEEMFFEDAFKIYLDSIYDGGKNGESWSYDKNGVADKLMTSLGNKLKEDSCLDYNVYFPFSSENNLYNNKYYGFNWGRDDKSVTILSVFYRGETVKLGFYGRRIC